jgi:hypothetical protein
MVLFLPQLVKLIRCEGCSPSHLQAKVKERGWMKKEAFGPEFLCDGIIGSNPIV